ncbi:MAG: DUF1194 domain-containing protein [Paracoccaceae bacterium]
MTTIFLRPFAVALLAATLVTAPVSARACAVSLVFALDISASVDADEYRLQRDGLAAALLDPGVRQAIAAQEGGVAFLAFEWSGRYQQDIMAGWSRIRSEAELEAFAGAIRAHSRRYSEFPTAIGYALGHAARLMQEAPPCARRVIDISGDGIGNEGFPPAAAYREFPFAGITVNGLVVAGADQEVVRYYQREIPHGEDAFVEVAAGFEEFGEAMRRKLLRELLGGQFVSAE